MDKRVGAQYYTIRDFCQTLEDFDMSCKKVSEIGYKIVQLSGIGDFEAEDIKKILGKYGLEAICTHRPYANYLNNLDKEIEFHKTIGAKICGLGSMPEFKAEPKSIYDYVDSFTTVANETNKNGLIFAYHNHSFEFQKINGKYVFDIIAEACENLKFIVDLYWVAHAGLNPVKFIEKYADKIVCVHFKDMKVVGNDHCFAEIGQGNFDWDEIIKVCEDCDIKYAIVEQDTCDGDPFDSLKISYDFLKKKGFN